MTVNEAIDILTGYVFRLSCKTSAKTQIPEAITVLMEDYNKLQKKLDKKGK